MIEPEFLAKKLSLELRQAFIDWFHGNQIDIKFNSVDRYYDYLINCTLFDLGFNELGNEMMNMYRVLFEPDAAK